jgi:hypothetical protein
VPKACEEHQPRETVRGSGPCQISYEVLQRSGKPNWWCRTHGMPAGTPDGLALERCPGTWFNPVPEDLQVDIDLASGQVAAWGVVEAAIRIGTVPSESGKVHVHRRLTPGAAKDIDRSFDIVRLRNGTNKLLIEGIAAVAFSISELAGRPIVPLSCPHCDGMHIDELKFATYPHRKHQCNSCGRNFWDRAGPSISNPLAQAQAQLGLPSPPSPARVDRQLELDTSLYGGIQLWPSNAAIVSTMSRAEDVGIHVHAWDQAGELVIDETHSPVSIDGVTIDEEDLRSLAVQRTLAHGAPIISEACDHCDSSLTSPTAAWIEPITTHTCQKCGGVTRTHRKVFLNPLAEFILRWTT